MTLNCINDAQTSTLVSIEVCEMITFEDYITENNKIFLRDAIDYRAIYIWIFDWYFLSRSR